MKEFRKAGAKQPGAISISAAVTYNSNVKSRSADTLPPYRILDRSGRRFGWVEMLRTWMFSDRIQATLRVPGHADWPFEGILHASPASLGKVLRSASERNLRHLLASPPAAGRLEALPPAPVPSAPMRLLRRLRRGNPRWQLARLESDPFESGRAKTSPMLPLPGVLRADPFAIRVGDRNWLLFEEQLPGDRGRLRAALWTEGAWQVREGEILPRPHHLSWPCVLEAEGRIFLLPESGEAGEVALWECVEFPFRWRKVRALLEGRPWHDPCLLRHGGLWWLFASAGGDSPQDHSSELCAFHSTNLLEGAFAPHALNPLSVSVAGARPAGNFFRRDGALYRPAQDCRGGYGTGILVQRIESLTPTEWAATTVGRIDPPRGASGIHTLNALPDGGWVVDVFG